MRPITLAACLALSATLASPVAAITLGQVDNFDSGTTEGWFAGSGPFESTPPDPPAVVSGGGPGGTGDAYLQITSNGSAGPGGKLVGMNAGQWAGDYLSAGVTGITMDLRNFGATDLTMRLYFEDPIPGPPMNEAVTSFAVNLVAGSDWVHVLFPISAADLTVLTGDATTLLSNTTVMRLFHGAGADFPGEPIAGLLGVDNIAAVAQAQVPEPASLALLLAGLGLLGIGGVSGRRAGKAR